MEEVEFLTMLKEKLVHRLGSDQVDLNRVCCRSVAFKMERRDDSVACPVNLRIDLAEAGLA